MKKQILSILLLVFVLTMHGQTGTTVSGKYKMSTPDTATATDSICTWDGYSKLIRHTPKSKLIDVLEYTNYAAFPGTGVKAKIYVDKALNKIYRWTGSAYTELSQVGPTPSMQQTATVGSNIEDIDVTFTNSSDSNLHSELSSYHGRWYNTSNSLETKIESDSISTPKISLFDEVNLSHGSITLSDGAYSFEESLLGGKFHYFDCGRNWFYKASCGDGYTLSFNTETFTNDRLVTYQNKSGTVALLDDITTAISNRVPYTGATADLNLGSHNFSNNGNISAVGGNVLGLTGTFGNVIAANSTTGVSRFDLYGPTYSFNAVMQVSELGSFFFGDIANVRNHTTFRVNDAGSNKYIKMNAGDGVQLSSDTGKFAILKTSLLSTDVNLEFPNNSGTLALKTDIPATISDLTAGTTYPSGLANVNDTAGSIKIGDWNSDVNGTTLEVNDNLKTVNVIGQVNQHYGNYADDTVDSSSFAVGPYTLYFSGKSGTSVDNFGTSTLLASPEEGNMLKKTAANGDYTQIVQDIDAHATSIQTYDESTNTASTLGVIPNDIAFTVQNDTDAYGLDMNTTGFSIIDEFRPNEYALHLETGGSELNAGQLANNTLTLGAYDVNGTAMTPFIELKSNNIPTMTLPQLAGSGTRMVTVNSTGEVGVASIPGGGGGSIILTTIGNSGAATLVGSDLNVPNYTLSGLGGVATNSSITGATKTKITYDSKGLVTAGADATTSDIADSTDKRYVTDAQLAKLNSITTSILPYVNTTPVNVTGTLSETQVLQISIPAYTFSSSDILSVTLLFSKSGTAGNCTWKMKMSTSATMPSGTTGQIGTGAFNSTSGFTGYERKMLTINGGNIYGFPFTTTTGNSDIITSGSAISSQPFDNTVQNYLYLSFINGSSADTSTLRGILIPNNRN